MLDYAEEIVIPALLDPTIERKYGSNRNFFYNTKLLRLTPGDVPEIGVFGRYIKDTVLERDQRYDRDKNRLVRDHDELESSPSSVFLFLLNTHRLIYFKETRFAPGLGEFALTLEKLLNIKREEYISELAQETFVRAKYGRAVKSELRTEIGKPSIEIIPLSSKATFSSFLKKFERLTNLDVKFVPTNDEYDPDSFFRDFEEQKDRLGSSSSSISHRNKGGLSIDAVRDDMKTVVDRGNTRMSMKGVDYQGDKIKGNNKQFALKYPVDQENIGSSAGASYMHSKFQDAVSKGYISLPSLTDKIKEKLKRIVDKYLSN
ncbi:MAG: hypothetical protein R3270_03580 [Gammaproteobacteria bacterium]|nr:hypothetical protein [Gammaproteobacteria bacterium]